MDLDHVVGDASRANVVSTYSDGATEWKKEIGATLVGFAIFFLVLSLGRLWATVRTAEGESVVVLKARLFPRWPSIGGLAIAVISFFGETTAAFGFPILLILLWVLAASVLLVRKDRVAASPG